MALRKFKPITAGTRWRIGNAYAEITTDTPEKSLLEKKSGTGGRNSQGRRAMRYIGGGNKNMYRVIDFKRNKKEIPATVASVEYDPNRTARIALLNYVDGEKRYILAPDGLKVGDSIVSSRNADIKPGNSLPLRAIPLGTAIHNVELKKGKGGQLCRSAGVAAQIMAKEGAWGQIRLPSGEVRLFRLDCRDTIGQVANADHQNISIGKAGRTRWLGFRPHNRGVTMNPVDHPMGGGEGRTSGGRHPCSPWGQLSKGLKTRNNKRTDTMIIKHRKA